MSHDFTWSNQQCNKNFLSDWTIIVTEDGNSTAATDITDDEKIKTIETVADQRTSKEAELYRKMESTQSDEKTITTSDQPSESIQSDEQTVSVSEQQSESIQNDKKTDGTSEKQAGKQDVTMSTVTSSLTLATTLVL